MDATCLTLGSLWTFKYLYIFPDKNVKIIIFIILLIGWIKLKVTLISIYCVYDRNGRSFVNGTLKEGQNKVKYQKTWDHRIRFLFGCVTSKKTSKISDISRIFGQYFIDLDVVPSDIVAGLKLLRKYQIREMEESIENKIVISIRGSLSMADAVTDLRGTNEVLPLKVARNDWLAHKDHMERMEPKLPPRRDYSNKLAGDRGRGRPVSDGWT
uniref:Uncharacterized protein n=1 Tax=Megaselia scalaris TaxID=36166 RepID=T1GUI2_MEGSC